MPYLNCPTCRLTVYSAAFYSTSEDCPRCATKLGRPSRLFSSPLPHRLAEAAGGLASMAQPVRAAEERPAD